MQKQDLKQISNLLDEKFKKTNKKFDAINKKFNTTDKKFDTINKRIDELAVITGKKFDAAVHLFATKDDLKDLKQELKEEMTKETNKILNAVDGVEVLEKKLGV